MIRRPPRFNRTSTLLPYTALFRSGDDVIVDAAPEGPSGPITLHFLRQQVDKPVERPDVCLADFIAPEDSGRKDWIGGFAVTAGIGIEEHIERFRDRKSTRLNSSH